MLYTLQLKHICHRSPATRLLKSIHVKDLHTSILFREQPNKQDTAWFMQSSLQTTKTYIPCHVHTYKAYFYTICFKLCIMTLGSELPQSKQLVRHNKIILLSLKIYETILVYCFSPQIYHHCQQLLTTMKILYFNSKAQVGYHHQ